MPDVDTSSYKPLQSQQQQLGPLQILQAIGQLNQNKLFQQEFQARQAIGDAYKNNTGDNGEINTPGLRSQIGQTGGFRAGEGLQQATTNSSADVDLKSKYQGILRNVFGELATSPQITDLDISKRKAAAAAQGVPAAAIQDFVSQIPRMDSKKGQAAARDFFVGQSNMLQGPGEYAKGVAVPGPSGETVEYPAGSAARVRAAGGLPTSLPPGVVGSFEEGQKSLVEDQKLAARATANLRNLDIALPLAEKLNHADFGPGSPEYTKLRAAAVTAGLIDPKASDVTIREELGKYLLKYGKSSVEAGRSDNALSAALGSNPNLDLNQAANLNLIKNQIGLDKMDAALPKIFKIEHPGQADAAGYNTYKSGYYDNFDRRVFSYDKLSPDERRGVIQSLGGKNSPAYKKFEKTYQLAKQAGIIVPEKKSEQ